MLISCYQNLFLFLEFVFLQKFYYTDEGIQDAICYFTFLLETSLQSIYYDGSL